MERYTPLNNDFYLQVSVDFTRRARFTLSSNKEEPALKALCTFSFQFGVQMSTCCMAISQRDLDSSRFRVESCTETAHGRKACPQQIIMDQNILLHVPVYSVRLTCRPNQHSAGLGVISTQGQNANRIKNTYAHTQTPCGPPLDSVTPATGKTVTLDEIALRIMNARLVWCTRLWHGCAES